MPRQASKPKRRRNRTTDVAPYLARLTELPFIKDAAVRTTKGLATAPLGRTTSLTLKTSHGARRIEVYVHGSHLDYVRAEALAAFRTEDQRPLVLMVPYVAPPMAQFLTERGVDFIDLQGNCRLSLGDGLHAEIVGRRPAPSVVDKGWRTAGYWTLFALLAEPSLLRAPVRRIAEAAGVGKSAAADAVARLRRDSAVSSGPEAEFLPGARARWAARWIEAYGASLRPRSVVGRYRTPDKDPAALEQRIATVFGTRPHAFGGAAGAYRFGGLYRSEQTILHVADFDETLRRDLKALPAADGELVVTKVESPTAYAGDRPHTAHPLLLYADISAVAGSADDRLHRTARALREVHLPWL